VRSPFWRLLLRFGRRRSGGDRASCGWSRQLAHGGAAIGGTTADAAKRVMDNIKRAVEAGGLTMDHLVWVQVFSSNLADYQTFNEVYRTYFKGPLPARAYLGADHLLGEARFEVMGIAVGKGK